MRGTPAIGFRVPGLRDSVLDGQTGGRGPGAVALLPWAAYRRYGWNEGGPIGGRGDGGEAGKGLVLPPGRPITWPGHPAW